MILPCLTAWSGHESGSLLAQGAARFRATHRLSDQRSADRYDSVSSRTDSSKASLWITCALRIAYCGHPVHTPVETILRSRSTTPINRGNTTPRLWRKKYTRRIRLRGKQTRRTTGDHINRRTRRSRCADCRPQELALRPVIRRAGQGCCEGLKTLVTSQYPQRERGSHTSVTQRSPGSCADCYACVYTTSPQHAEEAAGLL